MVQTIHAILAGQDEAAAAISRLVALGVGHEAIRTFGAANAVHVGSFADSGEHAHTPERDHVGSFANGDGNSVQQRTFVSALVAIGLPRADAEAAARAIAAGGVLVVARAEPGQVEAVAPPSSSTGDGLSFLNAERSLPITRLPALEDWEPTGRSSP